jgi:superfamily II DNA or RNA helicase|tara:strand:- start:327 stop:1523 length:1197 start_codon:yes stop_codon:yes gene_type:complete
MSTADKGQIIVPTGGGKTFIMIQDCLRQLNNGPKTIVVVAPRILLANQLCDEFMQQVSNTWTHVAHCHSGETHYFSSTKSQKIALFANTARAAGESVIIFTTYHSLARVVDSGIDIDCAYFDEAHNSVKRSFFVPTVAVSDLAKRTYFFTATPRIARHHRGMNNVDVYGPIIENVPAPELLNNGSIIAPTIVPFEVDLNRDKKTAHHADATTVQDVIDQLDDNHAAKVLVAVPSSRVLGNIIAKTDLLFQLKQRGYNVLHVTSKFGAYVNDKKVNREQFFDTLTAWGKDKEKKFVIFHYSILSEGINVPGLTHTILLRNLQIVEMAQTIGRVIRLDRDDAADIAAGNIVAGKFSLYRKPTGYVSVPVYKNYGKRTIQRLQNVCDAIFVKGIPPESFVA